MIFGCDEQCMITQSGASPSVYTKQARNTMIKERKNGKENKRKTFLHKGIQDRSGGFSGKQREAVKIFIQQEQESLAVLRGILTGGCNPEKLENLLDE